MWPGRIFTPSNTFEQHYHVILEKIEIRRKVRARVFNVFRVWFLGCCLDVLVDVYMTAGTD